MVDGAMPGLYGQYGTRNLCQKDAILTLLLQFDSLLLGCFAKQQFNMQEALCLLSQSDEARTGERMMNAVTPYIKIYIHFSTCLYRVACGTRSLSSLPAEAGIQSKPG